MLLLISTDYKPNDLAVLSEAFIDGGESYQNKNYLKGMLSEAWSRV